MTTEDTRRDLAVLVLLDVSGSTGGTEGQQKIIDIEKRTALIFGEGLAALGDAFAVCGFSSNIGVSEVHALTLSHLINPDKQSADGLPAALRSSGRACHPKAP